MTTFFFRFFYFIFDTNMKMICHFFWHPILLLNQSVSMTVARQCRSCVWITDWPVLCFLLVLLINTFCRRNSPEGSQLSGLHTQKITFMKYDLLLANAYQTFLIIMQKCLWLCVCIRHVMVSLAAQHSSQCSNYCCCWGGAACDEEEFRNAACLWKNNASLCHIQR